MITEPSEFMQQLQAIQDSTSVTYSTLPSDESRFIIDANTRSITIPPEFQFLGVKNDHKAETIYFEIDRYFDAVDLSTHTCVVQFSNSSNSGLYPVTVMDTETVDGKIIFGWEIMNDVTAIVGNINFSVRFYSVDENSQFIYNFNTLTANSVILDTLDVDNPGVVENYPSELEAWLDRMNDLSQNVVKPEDVQALDTKMNTLETSFGELNSSVDGLKSDLGDLYQGNQPFAIIKDEYVNQDGTIVKTDQHWDRTDYIEINGDVTIISSSNSGFNCFFDSSKNFVSSFLLVKGENKIAVPLNAKYMICSNTRDSMMELIVKSYNNDRITELKNEAKAHEIALKSRKNLIGTIPNKLYPIDYKANENITFSTKGLVPVTKSHIFYFYDENKEYVTDYALYPPLAKRTVSFDKDAKYISLKIEQEYPIQVEYGKEVTAFEPYLIESSTFNDKIIAILGYDPSYDTSWNDGGYIDRTNGTLTTYENWKYTDFIELKNTFGLIVDSNISDNTEVSTYNCFYDGNKNYICNFQISSSIERVEVPTDAKYYRLSIRTVDYCILSNAIKSISDISSMDSNSVSDDIITLNKEQEPFVIQSTATKAIGIGASLKPLTFIHFSDWHNVPALWVRICDYMNRYKDYIQFALHTGDYCTSWQGEYTDAYLLKETINPILNCVGNHDTYTKDMKENTQESAYKLLFNHTDDWNVTFGESANSMYYYKDFQESEIRLIVLDCYYDIDNQKTWLEARLNEAKDLNYAVITAMHEVSKTIIDKIQCTFQTLDNYESAGGNQSAGEFDAIIKAFKDNGGVHIVNLCGHEHDDMFGYTSNGVLNLVVECATTWNGWTGGKRIEGTKTYDCFNVFSVEKDTGIFKVVRIGDNSDHYLRAKNVLVYDYINKNVVSNF